MAAEYPGPAPPGNFEPRRPEPWMLTGSEGEALRLEALARATFDLPDDWRPADNASAQADNPLARPVPACRFVATEPSGTTPKFDCVFEGGETVKVKYGRNSEIHAETAATRLLRLLGYAADTVTIVPRLRCYGCPRYPFFVEQFRAVFDLPLRSPGAGGYTDFEWVAVEQKFAAQAIETPTAKGWHWWELDRSQAPRADLDAFRLTAMFLAHWDNKGENQRLVCLDDPPPVVTGACARPLAMIQDLGASFGPLKVNLARWRDLPVWHDRTSCLVSMRALPFEGATFEDAIISEAGRLQFLRRIAAITDTEIERLFADARFPQFQVGTDEERDLKAWRAAFRHRVDQIAHAGPCPS